MSARCWSKNDHTLGPQVLGCRGNFDFTIYFEEIVLIIAPLSVAILCFLQRFRLLRSQSVVAYAGSILAIKSCAWVCLSGLQVAQLTFRALSSNTRTSASIPAAALDLVAALGGTILSPLEHRHSIRPSAVLSAYLFITAIFDIAVTRTLWLALPSNVIPSIFTSRLIMKIVILVLESRSKTELLYAKNESHAIEDTGSIFSRILFLWLNPLLWKGNRYDLSIEDLPRISSGLSRADNFPGAWKHDEHKTDRHRLLQVLVKDLKWPILAGLIPRLGVIGFKYVQPFMIRRMIRWLDEPLSATSQNEGYGLIAAFGLVFIGLALCNSRYQHLSYRLVVMIRTRMISVIYQKTFAMDILQDEDRAPITLMSTDVERISHGLGFLHDVWGSIVEVAIAIWLLWRELHVYAAATLIIASTCVVTALTVGKLTGRRQQAWIEAVQRRIAITSSALPHLKNIKSAGMVEIVTSVLEQFRLDEVKASKRWRRLTVLMVAVGFYNSALAPVISFTSYVLTSPDAGGVLSLDKAMTVLTIFALFGAPLNMLSESASGFFSGIACIERIRRFLVSPDRPQRNQKLQFHDTHTENNDDLASEKATAAIALTDAAFAWSTESNPGIDELTMRIEKSTVTVFFGPVGCGKSTLLCGLLSENHLVKGHMSIGPSRIAYCSQTPWITNATLRENVIGCTPFDEIRYQEVIRCCGLVQDIASLRHGDQTKLGSGGAAISGGQKQRVALARAAFSSAEILVLDDVLSGLDSITAQHVLNHLLGPDGLLRRQKKTVIIASSYRNCLDVADKIVWLDRTGHISNQETVVDLRASSSSSVVFDPSKNEEQQPTVAAVDSPSDERRPTQLEEDLKQRKGDWRVLQYYILHMGAKGMLIFILLMIVFTFFYGFAPVWVELWARSSGTRLNTYVGIYYMIAASQILFIGIAAAYLLLVLLPRASVNFHHILLQATTNAPLSFLTSVDVGTITNRFSQDLQLIDTELPISLFNTIMALGYSILLLVIICVSGRYIAATLPFLLGIMFFVQRSYLHSSRQIRLLDLSAKAPLFSHFSETLDGLITIRALGWQTRYEERLQELLTTSQRPFYALYCVQRWLNLVIDLIIAAIAIIFSGIAVALHGSLSTGLVGLALINIITFNGNIRVLVFQYTNLETSIAAVARVRAYERGTPAEVRPGEEQEVSHDWPRQGRLEIVQASASYSNADSLILKNVSLSIPAGSKVGICGRSGSGKSSLFAVLLRMLDLERGSVLIDGICIADVPRSTVRARLNALPQEPYFIPDTPIRACIDPFAHLEDGQIKNILEDIQLWEHLGGSDAALDLVVGESLLSHGQRQLLSLGRAMARRASTGNILLLDEATSQLDTDTEEIVRQVIRRCFSDHTVISIAHRLDIIADYDLIAVLDEGNVIEVGAATDLLTQASSAFRQLYDSQRRGD